MTRITKSANGKAAIAARAWQLMFDYLIASAPRRARSLANRGLTPNDARALAALAAERGRTLGELAKEWACDPSNVTWMIDRLERAKLAERRPVASDRRVKEVTLTSAGVKVKSELMREFGSPPPEILTLGRAELGALERILRKLRPAHSRRPRRAQRHGLERT
ncbi:MAG: MarR family transcriptional regulator [Gammaproteobacteria bacterium]|nr:MAG: MarR family transcriptional regulator [Gammaproteobacteria bacterium]